MSMGIENMTAEEVRGAQRLLLAVCGELFSALARAAYELSGEAGVAPEEEPEEVPEEETGEGDGGDGEDGDGGGDGEPEEPERRYRGPAITDEEVADWAEKREQGIPVAEIARMAGRGITTVGRKLKEYDQAAADAAEDAAAEMGGEDGEGDEE